MGAYGIDEETKEKQPVYTEAEVNNLLGNLTLKLNTGGTALKVMDLNGNLHGIINFDTTPK